MNGARQICVVVVVGGLPYGGVEIGLLDLLTHLDTERFNTGVINLSGTGNLVARYQDHRIDLINMNMRLSTHRLDTTWHLRQLLRRLVPDVIMTSHFSANYHARLAALGLRARVITYIHNTRGERYWERQLADRLLGRFATDRFVAVSRKVQTYLVRQVPAAVDKTTLLYHAVAPERLQRPADYARDQFRHQEGIQGSHFLVTAIGRAVYEKGFDLLLTAFARVYAAVPEARLLIAGDGGMLPELEALIDRLRLRSCVRLLGYRDDIPSLLTASDVFVLPSRQEGFGLAALEAMALGVPVVLTEVAPITEVLTHGKTGWIVHCRPEDIADGILALYHDAATRHRMSCQAKSLFEQDLTMTAYAEKMGRIIDETVTR